MPHPQDPFPISKANLQISLRVDYPSQKAEAQMSRDSRGARNFARGVSPSAENNFAQFFFFSRDNGTAGEYSGGSAAG